MVKVKFVYPYDCSEIKDMTLVDMHCHTTCSDGLNHADHVIERARELKIAISITDHNDIQASLKASKAKFSIPGIEATSSDAIDFLFYFHKQKDIKEFYNKYVQGRFVKSIAFNLRKLNLNSAELLENVNKYNALVALPHPFAMRPKNSFEFMKKHKHLMKHIHAIEVLNSVMSKEGNLKAIEWAKETKLAYVGGSDAHMVKHLGMCVTASYASNTNEFLENIFKKKNHVVGTNIQGFEKMKTSFSMFRSNLTW